MLRLKSRVGQLVESVRRVQQHATHGSPMCLVSAQHVYIQISGKSTSAPATSPEFMERKPIKKLLVANRGMWDIKPTG